MLGGRTSMYTVVMELLARKRACRFTDSAAVLQSASHGGKKKSPHKCYVVSVEVNGRKEKVGGKKKQKAKRFLSSGMVYH